MDKEVLENSLYTYLFHGMWKADMADIDRYELHIK